MPRTAVDGDFNQYVGHTETSFESFLAAMGMSAEADPTPTENDVEPVDYNLDDLIEDPDNPTPDVLEEDDDLEEDQDDDADEEEESEAEEADEEADSEGDQEEEDVDFGELEIDMDSEIQIGEEFVSINDLIRNRIQRQELEEKIAENTALAETLSAKETNLATALDKAILECDKVIEDYKTFDWKKLAKEEPESYAQHREFLEAYLSRKEEIEEEYEKIQKVEADKAAAVKQEAVVAAVKELKAAIPEWNDALYGSMMDYAIKTLGMSEAFVTESVDPGFFKTVHGLMKRDKDLKLAVTKVRKPVVKKVAKASSSSKAAVKKAAGSKKVPTAGEVGIASYDVASYNAFAKLGIT